MTETFKWTAGVRYTHDKKEHQGPPDAVLGSGGERRRQNGFTSSAQDETTFKEYTGRFGFDWKPGWFDDSTLYAFYSRGYKAGGFNPPLDRNLPEFAGTPEVYEPEFVNAFEIGSKNMLAGGRAQANLTAFYYQYDASAGVEDRRAHVGQRERRRQHLRPGRRVRVQPGQRLADRHELRVPEDQDQGLQQRRSARSEQRQSELDRQRISTARTA